MSEKKRNFLSWMKNRKLEKKRVQKKRAEIIGEIISRRNFDVPASFVLENMTDAVMDYIAEKIPVDQYNIAKYSSIAMMNAELDKHTIGNYRSFIENVKFYMESSKLRMDFTRKSFLQKMTIPMAILTLTSDYEWEAFLKMKRKTSGQKTSFLLYLSLLIVYMKELNCAIPAIVVDTVLRYTYDDMLLEYVKMGLFDITAMDYLIHQADVQGKLSDKLQLIFTYWKAGGTYFPESSDFVEDMVEHELSKPDNHRDCTYQMMIYLQNVEREEIAHSYGYYLFMYSYTMMKELGLETSHNLLFSTLRNLFVVHTQDITRKKIRDLESVVICDIFDEIMNRDASLDVNTLGYLFNLPFQYPDESYKALREKRFGMDADTYDDTVRGHQLKRSVERLMITSKIPLRDMTLYKELFDRYIPSGKLVEDFIIFGGRPATIEKAGLPESSNICHRVRGIELILKYTADEDILPMFSDTAFIDKLRRIATESLSSGVLTIPSIKRLLSLIMQLGDPEDSFGNLVDHLIRLLGGNIPLECVEYYTMKPNVKTDTPLISGVIRSLGSDCIEHIPAYILPKNILMQRLKNAGSSFLKLHTNYLPLDYIVTSHELDSILLDERKIQYIPDLSFEYRQNYLHKLIYYLE